MVKKLLELFCGTKSVGNVFKTADYEIVSLDYNKKFDATHTEDILNWNYKQYPPNYFDVIWASPDCTTWSIATAGKYRTKERIYGNDNQHKEKSNLANNMILRVIEIIKYFQPKSWFIENPRGLLIHFPELKEFIKNINAYNTTVYYGNYDNWGFPKPTHIWSNIKLWTEKSPIMNEDLYIILKRKNGTNRRVYKEYSNNKAKDRSKIPPSLINRLRLLIPNEI